MNKQEKMPNQNFVTGKTTIKNENKIKAFRPTESIKNSIRGDLGCNTLKEALWAKKKIPNRDSDLLKE